MDDIDRIKLRADVDRVTQIHSGADLKFKAAQMELEHTREALIIALMRENHFLQTGLVLTDEQVLKMRNGQ